MSKKELVTKVAEDLNLTKKEVELIIDTTLSAVKSEIKEGNKVQLYGFGNFEPKTNKARVGINPATKEKIQIAESKSVKFKVAKAFKDELN